MKEVSLEKQLEIYREMLSSFIIGLFSIDHHATELGFCHWLERYNNALYKHIWLFQLTILESLKPKVYSVYWYPEGYRIPRIVLIIRAIIKTKQRLRETNTNTTESTS